MICMTSNIINSVKRLYTMINLRVNTMVFFLIYFISINLFASLSGHPTVFKETLFKGGTKIVKLHISNSLSSPLTYSFSIFDKWIRAEPTSGSVDGYATLTVSLIIDATNITEGKYSTEIYLNDPHHGWIPISVEANVETTTDIKEINVVPTEYKLMQNYPNPFNPSTIISYSIPEAQNVSLVVYDLLGKEVAVLVNEVMQPGIYNSQFAILNSKLSSGIYFYTLKTNRFTQTKKMLLTK